MTPQQALDEARARLGPNGQARVRISGGKISYVVGLRDGLAFRVLGSGTSHEEALASLVPALALASAPASVPTSVLVSVLVSKPAETTIPQETAPQTPRCCPRRRPRDPRGEAPKGDQE